MNPHAYLVCVVGTTKLGCNFNANFVTVTSKRGTELAKYFTEEAEKMNYDLPPRMTLLGVPDPHKDEVSSVTVTSVMDCGEEDRNKV